MKREIMKVAVCGMLTVCITVATGFTSVATDTQSETQGLITQTENHEWYNKALANTKNIASVYQSTDENSRVEGRMYKNTIVNIEEKGEEWTRISSGDVKGYVKNETLAFGLDAVERAQTVCPKKNINGMIIRETQNAKTTEQILVQETARKAAEEAEKKVAEKKAAEEAAKKSSRRSSQKKSGGRSSQKKAAARKAANESANKGDSRSPQMTASVDDRTLLAAIIYCEAGGEPYQGKVAVGAVVLNRVRSSRFPNTISGVIYQKGQFGPAKTGKLARVLSSGKTSADCFKAADDALAGSNPIGNRMFFGNGNTGYKIGSHYFH